MERAPVILDGAGLSCGDVHAVGYGRAEVAAGPAGRARAAWAAARELTGPVYGRATGVGANKDVAVEHGGHDLLRSHACGAGPLVAPERARAMLAVRLNQLLAGGSGVDPAVLPVLAYAVNAGFTPPVRTYGAIGTGDLTALATTALCLLGELPWRGPEQGSEQGSGPEQGSAHSGAGAAPVFALAPEDALPFISSGAATLADAALACHRLRELLDAALGVAALSFAAAGASAEPLAAAVQEARPHPGQAAVAERLRALHAPGPSARVQDLYGYRAFAQVHGAAVDALDRAERVVETDLNAATENPLVSGSLAWHNGNFHSAPVALALDALRAALVQTAQLGAARLATLMDPAYTGGLPFLADRPGASGAMILEYVAQDALAELRHLAGPVTTGTAVISLGTEDHAGFATQAARQALRCVEPYEIVLACERVAATRALNGPAPDRPLTGDLDAALSALRTP
ncbi:aromatic amino acid ammonia-lyase [Nonomuraea roseoviolacea]|uniref:Histidine ammonia-lyase n=1 Tax=Nonomuraea roseoviolacea subsp. carminata TaxID=160689 RepID=A0ABT1K677_9ACTN|nr:aromatic amino acid ammonia-lyase [Nonomuraea roseoviolacea]MCP2348936.1 histidine ammonia-lyase [Nonomuraea roseoviolacea subsp. carminata]